MVNLFKLSHISSIRDIAQLGRAPALGAGGRRFKSYYPEIKKSLLLFNFLCIMNMFISYDYKTKGFIMTTIRQRIFDLRESVFDSTSAMVQRSAIKLGFPENPGMPLISIRHFPWNKPGLVNNLPIREVAFPPDSEPQNYLEVLLGNSPAVNAVQKHFYESQTEGYYNFYVDNYKNLLFLPNSLSEFLQIQCNFCIDISFLEICRETLFVMLVLYYYMISFRILIAWLITINPYSYPIAYFIALVDWVEDISMGLLPVIGGISLATPILMTIIGKMADSLNHVIFTMPFLPSEGVAGQAYVNGEFKDVLYFRYLPILWYKYPIPNDLREYWYNERPDILKYMQEAYKDVDIQFLPNRILETQESIGQGEIKLITNLLLTDPVAHIQQFTNNFNFETLASIFCISSN